MKIKQISGDFKNCSGRYALVAGRFNQSITDRLIQGATDALTHHGINSTDIDCFWVPGAFEIPLLARKLVGTGNYVAIITLGAVIRGATAHFDFVAGTCANGIAELSLRSNIPVIFGVLTTDTVEQAIERSGAYNHTLLSPDKTIEQATELAGSKSVNKGADCALAALEMVSLLKQL